ncbi:FtsQ-type POTRA domain-containing protein [Streptomyces sp. NPDC048664]|uniref:cell division protein FtsQ/DivIB n=1 Tax=Streptomyces sp. NPDC048664 TaxID=3154505 RepID=UPI00344227C4
MAGPTTAERGRRQKPVSGPPRPPRPRRLPRSRRLIISSAAVTLVAGGVIWLLYGSPWLRERHISVSGTRVLTAAQVREAAGVAPGTPLVSLDTGEIEARVRHRLPRVDSVSADRSWPHGIELRVTERRPVLLLGHGGKFDEVDREGVRFATLARPLQGVPRVELTQGRSEAGRRFTAERLLRAAARITQDLPAAVTRDLRTVKAGSYDSVSLELGRGRTVLWGSEEKGRAKAVTLTALMKAAPDARHFDVSVPSAPASAGS